MTFLVDTNVLVRLEDSLSPQHAESLGAIEILKREGYDCQIVPQVLYEFWVVATRPVENNGLGLDVQKAEDAIREWISLFRLRLDERGVFRKWMSLVSGYQVRGKISHDARLVAAMEKHGIVNLLTFNGADFVRFSNIKIFSPADVVAGHLPS